MATSSIPDAGQGIPSDGIRLIRLVEAKVTKLVEEFHAYVKEAIETALAPNKADLEVVKEEQKSIRAQLQFIKLQLGCIKEGIEEGLPTIRVDLQRVKTQLSALDPPEIVLSGPILPPAAKLFSIQVRVNDEPRVDHSPERDDVEKDDDVNDRSKRQSESEPDSDMGDETLESVRSMVRASGIPPDEVDTVVYREATGVESTGYQRRKFIFGSTYTCPHSIISGSSDPFRHQY
ncbi:hypothetical protein K7X08_014672 [Anisodus acutangulus]|uniref:Uncharacterized protein n=1 Tax=Anisodus acutangulus TaxID=402998 RepID=A0A9Q1LIW5_9SOLA|nr:hypothetical protein K7X08_014672 [Anisodus acutangulus]